MPASTVTECLAALPADRREALSEVRRGINRALGQGYLRFKTLPDLALDVVESTIARFPVADGDTALPNMGPRGANNLIRISLFVRADRVRKIESRNG